MRIGIDIRTLMDKNYSGVSEYTYNLLHNIFKLDKENEYILFYNSGKDVSARIPKFDYPNVSVVSKRFPNKVFNYILQKIFRYPKIDQLLSVDLFFMPHINFIALSENTKKIITVHDLSYLKFKNFFSWRKRIWHYFINTKKLLTCFNKIIAVSENTRSDINELCSIGYEKITTIHSGISSIFKKINDIEELKKVKEKYGLPDKFILYLGTIEPRKNIRSLIQVFNKLQKHNSKLQDYHLVMAGSLGWKTQGIINEYNNSLYKDKIKILGYIDHNDKPAIYSLSSLFVYISFYEGFGFPVLEAMSCGVPVVTSFNSSLPEIVENSTLLVDPYNINEIYNSIVSVISNEKLKNDLIEKGFRQIKKFDWEASARKYLEIFKN